MPVEGNLLADWVTLGPGAEDADGFRGEDSAVDQLADRLERSRGWIVKQALSTWVAQEEERDRLTQEAMADVDVDQVIDHQAVQAWADSLSTDDPLPIPR